MTQDEKDLSSIDRLYAANQKQAARIDLLEQAIAVVLFDYDTTGRFILQHREKLASAMNDESHK